MNQWGNVNSPMPMGPVQPAQRPMIPQAMQQQMQQAQDPIKQREQNIQKMSQMAIDHASSDPNSMVCPTCGGSGVKQGKAPR